MKKMMVMLTAGLFIIFAGCRKEETPSPQQSASEEVDMGANYVDDVYYSLADGIVSTVVRDNWDIAFGTAARSSSILINEGSGVELYVYPTDDTWTWGDAIDTTGIESWNPLWNSDESWEDGAFSRNATGHPNYGWGEYDAVTHDVIGVTLYVIKLTNGDFKQIFIDKKYSVDDTYDFRYADLDGSNEKVVQLDLSGYTDKNYLSYSLVNGESVDREPLSTDWDMLFTRYYDESIPYYVTGVLTNLNVQTIRKEGVDSTDNSFNPDDFTSNISEIGSDWKTFDMSTFSYKVVDSLAFFVKTPAEKVYKVMFTGFEGSSSGIITFNKTDVQ
jgi:hypothetical protein